MATHDWLFPWIALAAGLLTFAAGVPGAVRRALLDRGHGPPLMSAVVWLLVSVGAIAIAFQCGQAAGVDVVAARGMALGIAGGLLLVVLCSGSSASLVESGGISSFTGGPSVIGAATALTAAARLWLTHGEISGLGAFALGATLSVLTLGFSGRTSGLPAIRIRSNLPLTLGLLYLVGLSLTVMVGFSRASELKQMYWADIPLLVGAAVSTGLLVASGVRRLAPRPAALPFLPLLSAGVLAPAAISHGVAHSWRPAEMTALGALVFGIILGLNTLPLAAGSAGWDAEASVADGEIAAAAGSVLLVAASLVAFGVWSGYGMGLLFLGGWFVVGERLLPPPDPVNGAAQDSAALNGLQNAATGGMAFGCLLLAHRLLVLQAGPGIRLSGPGDTWDLLGIAAGAFLPVALAGWRIGSRGAEWRGAVEWAAGLGVSIVLVTYLWGPRFTAGVLVGTALSQLIPTVATSLRTRAESIAVSGLVLSLGTFLALPLFQHLASPTRQTRVIVILVCAACVMARVLLARPTSSKEV